MESQTPESKPSANPTIALSDAEHWRIRRVYELLIKIEHKRALKLGVSNETQVNTNPASIL